MTESWPDLDETEREFLASLVHSVRLAQQQRQKCPSPELLLAAGSESLPEGIRGSILEHLTGCATCQILSEDMKSVESMELTPQERARIWARLEPALPPSAKAFSWNFVGSWILRPAPATALAVLVVALAGLILVQRKHRQENVSWTVTLSPTSTVRMPFLPFEKPGLPRDAPLFWRGGATNPSRARLRSALVLYEKGDYATAARQLEQVEKSYPTRDAKFYDGICLLLLGDAPGAMERLEAAKAVGKPDEIHQAAWYLAMAEQRAGRNDSAFSELQQLCKAGGSYAVRACEAIKSAPPP